MSHLALAAALLAVSAGLNGESGDEDFRPYTEPPRLLLRSQRLRLLKRERERQSQRWQQFAGVAAAADVPEPGFTRALYYAVTGDAAMGRRAIEWALHAGADPRQVALVFDWCKPLISADEARLFVERLRAVAVASGPDSANAARTRAFAAIAIATEDPTTAERALRDLITNWWRKTFAPAMAEGRTTIAPEDNQPIFELLHAISDNVRIDLREDVPTWFRYLPQWQVLAHYPAPFEGSENEYFIPAYAGAGQPDLKRAALSRIAGLSMVAYDTNSREAQFLQGWLMLDRFALRSAFGSPYEFLWANPYLPGLSYHHMPDLFHDPSSGRLALRSSWDEDAIWFGFAANELQQFSNGRSSALGSGQSRPAISIGKYRVFFGEQGTPLKFSAGEVEQVIFLGLVPNTEYQVQATGGKPETIRADRRGTALFQSQSDTGFTLRISPAARGKSLSR